MNSFFRNKAALSLAVLLIAGMAIGVLHNRALESGGSVFVVDVVRTVLAPIDMTCHRVFLLGGWLARVSRPRGSILSENAELRREVRRLTEENARLAEAANENVALRRALDLKQRSPLKLISAEVISRRDSSWFDTISIDRGTRSGIAKGAAVVDARGLVGQVTECDLLTSQVVAITDSSSAVGAMVLRSRSTGILQGSDIVNGESSDYPVLTYLPKDADVRKGDIIVSSGKGQVIPKGFVIGRVVRVVRNSVAGSTSALVRPSVRIDQLEQVFVVKPGDGVER